MNYSSLTAAQMDQVKFLFADHLLGTDPDDYEYEVNGSTVTGRKAKDEGGRMKDERTHKPHSVTMNVSVSDVPALFVTGDMQRDAVSIRQGIARRIVARLINQNVEA